MARRIQRRRTRGWRMPTGARYIGRPGRWGNPFPVENGDRATAVAKYRTWLATQPRLILAARRELRGHDLACWCAPDAPCHGDVLLEVANVPLFADPDGVPDGRPIVTVTPARTYL